MLRSRKNLSATGNMKNKGIKEGLGDFPYFKNSVLENFIYWKQYIMGKSSMSDKYDARRS